MRSEVSAEYGSRPGVYGVFDVRFGLEWVRRRQQWLARVALALFCAAWLQAAVAPCVMAHSHDGAPRSAAPDHRGHGAHDGHDRAAPAAGSSPDPAEHPCLYCPADEPGAASCDGQAGCAYPHEPQVDARAAGGIFAAVPVSFLVPSPGARLLTDRVDPTASAVSPRVSLSVSYCRFLE